MSDNRLVLLAHRHLSVLPDLVSAGTRSGFSRLPIPDSVTNWVRAGRSLGPDGAHRRVLVGPGGIALICTIQHLGRVRITSLGLLNRAGEPIPDVDQVREHGWLLAEQFATTHQAYVPVTPVLVATPFTRLRAEEPPIGFTVTTRWKIGSVLADLPTVLTPADMTLVTARLRTRLR